MDKIRQANPWRSIVFIYILCLYISIICRFMSICIYISYMILHVHIWMCTHVIHKWYISVYLCFICAPLHNLWSPATKKNMWRFSISTCLGIFLNRHQSWRSDNGSLQVYWKLCPWQPEDVSQTNLYGDSHSTNGETLEHFGGGQLLVGQTDKHK